MKFPHPVPVRQLAEAIGAELLGDETLEATGINEIHHVEPGDVTFVDVRKYFDKSLQSDASVILLHEKTECPPGKALLVCPEPFDAYNELVLKYRPYQPLQQPIHPSAEIDPTVILEPNVVIGPGVKIGKNAHLQANVTIAEHTIIGDKVTVQSGSVIGTEAFYFKRTDQGFYKWRSGGRVILEEEVDIGAGCTINKGVSSDTIIGRGTKLDGQVHIGHDVIIGKHCLLAAQVGIGGNTRVGDEVVMYGQVGIAQNLRIGDRVVILAKSGVSKDLDSDKVYFGYPAAEARSIYRELAALRQLPDWMRSMKK